MHAIGRFPVLVIFLTEAVAKNLPRPSLSSDSDPRSLHAVKSLKAGDLVLHWSTAEWLLDRNMAGPDCL